MSKYKLFFLVVLLSFTKVFTANAQSGTATDPGTNLAHSAPDIIPPSPQAFSFTKYGNLPVGLFTGTAQYSIPIYSIKSGSLTHNLSLGYSTNGIKVDEIAGRTGMGWTFSAGGVITRTVQGLPDEFASRVFYHGPTTEDNSDWWNYVRQAGYASPPDFQPDEYSFNVDGMNGKFIRREDGTFKMLNASAVKIQQTTSPAGFILTATNGTKYFFNVIETTKTLSLTEPVAPETQPPYSATSWFLSKILTPTRDSVVFNYTSFGSTLQYENGVSQEYSTYIPGDYSYRLMRFSDESAYMSEALGPACLDPECLYLSTNTQITGNNGYYLSSIDFKGGRVELSTSLREDVTGERRVDSIHVIRTADNARIKSFALKYVYSYNNLITYSNVSSSSPRRKRLFLTEVHELSKDLASSIKTSLVYDNFNDLPPRLSYSQDKSGYFNGKVNQYFFPNDTWVDKFLGGSSFGGNRNYDFNYAKKGVLKKVIYPTGGSTSIEYEPHRVKNLIVWRPVIDSSAKVTIDTSTTLNQNIPFYSDTFSLVPGRQLRLRVRSNWATTPAPYFPESYTAIISVMNATNNTCVYSCDFQVLPGTEWVDYLFHEKLVGLGSLFKLRVTASQARLRVSAIVDKITMIEDTSQNVGIGGVRVKSIIDSSSSVTESGRREFIYGDWENPANTSGTGLFIDPGNNQFVSAVRRFAITTRYLISDNGTRKIYAGNTILHSNSVRSLYMNEMGTVVYGKVIELNHSSSGKNNGGTEYNFHTARTSSATALRDGPLVLLWNFSPFLADGASKTNDDFLNGEQQSTLTFTYTTKNGPRSILTEKTNYYSVNYLTPVPDTFYLVRQVRKRDDYVTAWKYFADYDINKYLRYYKWVKLDSTIEKQFETSGEIRVKTAFTYSGSNYQVRESSSTGSDQLLKKVQRKFPADVFSSQPGYSIYAGMVNQNIVDPVIEETAYSDPSNQLLSTKKTGFANLNFGSYSMYLPDTLKSAVLNTALEADVRFDLYDDKGNILQFTGKNGIVQSFIWGYNKQYPVAKITGKSYNDAISQSGLSLAVVNAPANDNAMRLELNKLRSLSSCMVSSLTYSPMIGITSETDVNGRTNYYEYDRFNRLTLIRDQDNKIVRKICYNYNGQPESCVFDPAPQWTSTGETRCQPCSGNASYFTGQQEHKEVDNNINSTTYGTFRWVSDGTNASCILAPDWQNTATAIRCRVVGGINTGEREREQMDMNPCTNQGTRWVIVDQNCTVCPKPANWQGTGNFRCVKDGSNNNTGQQEREERDMESCSATYNQTRWVNIGANCTTCPKPGNWQSTGNYRCVKDGSNNNTGEQEREERDMESCSATYNQTRWVNIGANCTTCPKPTNWQSTGNYRCVKDGNNNNTGQQEREERDMESCSATYNQLRWVSAGINCSSCPTPANWQATGNYRCVKDVNNNNTGAQEREEKDIDLCSATANQTRWVSNGTNCATCPKPANWQPSGVARCVKDANNNNTGYQELEEIDNEPCSATYNNIRWVSGGYNPSVCGLPIVCGPLNCKGQGKKCVNGVCETGVKVYTSTYYNSSTNQTVCVYHYEFSDNSWSIDYYEYNTGAGVFCIVP